MGREPWIVMSLSHSNLRNLYVSHAVRTDWSKYDAGKFLKTHFKFVIKSS